MKELLWLAPFGSTLAIVFSIGVIIWMLRKSEGTPQMIQIARAVREGASAYLKRQYKTVAIFFIFAFFILLLLVKYGYLPIFVPFAFVTGGFFSGLSGFVGMKVATQASSRTANGARRSLNSALKIAFLSGSVMGLIVVGLGLLDLSVWYYILDFWYRNVDITRRIFYITSTMLTFELGASSMALFARVGGGIYTKAADVGADLVGKIEAGIPEDDPRNPAVIADNVGDNVGDVAGMGADLYESYVGSIVATMALAAAAGLGVRGVTIPMIMASIGIISSIIGVLVVKTKEEASQSALLWALRRGIFFTAGLIAVCGYFLITRVLGPQHIGVYFAVISGLIAGLIIGVSTEFFTSHKYPPTRGVAQAALTGPATVIISGLSVGMLSTVVPLVTVAIATLLSFYFAGGFGNFNLGLYGVGISAIGMLSTLGITLATDAYGPIADNAGGNAQMAGLPPEVRERTDALDALGNTTAATGKGFAIGSAALTALALIAAYKDHIEELGAKLDLSILNPKIIVGMFIGGMLPFLFSSLTMKAVGRAAGKIVDEVRRQFREVVGILEGTAKPDYARCVEIVTVASQREMILPSAIALLSPIVVGIIFGVEANIGLLLASLVTGFVLAIMLANSGASWDNAKKYIEEGNLGGKGSSAHKASVVGDTVGDPCKDTSGPSLNILIKLMSMASIVFAAFILKNTLLP
ncbi:MAG: sodium-translocating pyrophosphatase [Candidatus Omnitrophica bacterium 4484_49]|nr:MAG: sodium-translocating pyrophosphatase [Candidatus Omnitrophica bacterium 4484_49]